MALFIFSAADKLADECVGGNKTLVDYTEKLQSGKHLAKLLVATYAFGNGGEKLCRGIVHNCDFVGEGGVKLIVSLVLEGRDVGNLTAADICPHCYCLSGVCTAEVVVADGSANKSEPCALEDNGVVELNIAACRNVKLKGIGVMVGNHIVKCVNALKNNNFVLAELDGL